MSPPIFPNSWCQFIPKSPVSPPQFLHRCYNGIRAIRSSATGGELSLLRASGWIPSQNPSHPPRFTAAVAILGRRGGSKFRLARVGKGVVPSNSVATCGSSSPWRRWDRPGLKPRRRQERSTRRRRSSVSSKRWRRYARTSLASSSLPQ